MGRWNTKGRRSFINTFESILFRLKANYTGQASTMEGTIVGDVLQAVANELARIYSQELEPMEDDLFLQTARGQHLEALCGNYSITRQENESDDSLRARALQQIRQPALAGNAAHYIAWAMEMEGVRAASAAAGAPGTVQVYYFPTEDAPEDLQERLQAHLEANCPLGAAVQAVEATPCNLTVAATVDLKSTAVLQEVYTAFDAAVRDYFHRVALTEAGDRISPGRLVALLLDCAGVVDVTAMTINEAEETLILPDGSYPCLESLKLSRVTTNG